MRWWKWTSVALLAASTVVRGSGLIVCGTDSLPALACRKDLMPIASLPLRKSVAPQLPLPTAGPPERVNKVRPARAVALAAFAISANTLAYEKFKNIWWQHPTTAFHLYRGWRQNEGWYDLGPHDSLWLHMDKFGHYYNARLLSLAFADAFEWIGLKEKSSTRWGALAGWLIMLQIELFDSRYREWGFSIGDMLANTAGAAVPLLSEKSVINRFTLKWSYQPSGGPSYWMDDYEAMTFWLCANPRDFLPPELRAFWPAFINLAVGYGITQKAYGEIEWSLALDYNPARLQPRHPALKKVLSYLNYLHLPAPTVRLKPHVRFDVLGF